MKKYSTFLNHTLIKIGLLCVATSCITQSNDNDNNLIEISTSDEDQYGPYPASPSTNGESKDDFPLNCNHDYEWIMIKGPNDELIIIKAPIECNPFADMYIGDPSPI